MRVDRYFRVFRNNLYPFIDVKRRAGGPDRAGRDRRRAVHPPPGRVRARLDARARAAARRPRRRGSRARAPRPPRPADPLDRRLHRPGLGRARDARALERRQPADHDLPRDEDRPALLHAADRARASTRTARASSARSTRASAGPTPSRYWKNFAAEAPSTGRHEPSSSRRRLVARAVTVAGRCDTATRPLADTGRSGRPRDGTYMRRLSQSCCGAATGTGTRPEATAGETPQPSRSRADGPGPGVGAVCLTPDTALGDGGQSARWCATGRHPGRHEAVAVTDTGTWPVQTVGPKGGEAGPLKRRGPLSRPSPGD